jgi:Cytochrome c peroxidase
MKKGVFIGLGLLFFLACQKEQQPALTAEPEPLLVVPKGFPVPVFPADNALTSARFALGKRLFYDPVMSRDSTVSSASCHAPNLAFSDSVAFSPGAGAAAGKRNSPTLANVAYHPYFTREGGVPTLEMQILVPIQEHNEFDFNILLIAERLKTDTAYVRMSREAYGRDPDFFVITRGIACFERTLISGGSRFDQFYFSGKNEALTAAELARYGYVFFRKNQLCSVPLGV